MPTPFASIEERVNKAIIAKTANATALFDGQGVDGVFDKDPGLDLDVVSNALSFTYLSGAFSVDPDEGETISIDGVSHVLSGPPEMDRGYTILKLFKL